jgi:hypothetical protein
MNNSNTQGFYIVQFEDDGGFERHVNPQMVLEYPNK